MDLPSSDTYYKLSVDSFDTEKLLTNATRQRDKRGYHKFPIIDADAHQYETESISEIIEFLDDPVIQQLSRANPGFLGGARGGVFGSGLGECIHIRVCAGGRAIANGNGTCVGRKCDPYFERLHCGGHRPGIGGAGCAGEFATGGRQPLAGIRKPNRG